MKILFDICHPAHVHFFKYAYHQLMGQGHEVMITTRDKDCTLDLLKRLNLPHKPLYTRHQSSWASLGQELIKRDKALFEVVKAWRPDIMAGIGGIFIAHVSKLTGVPAIVFYDGDNALAQNLLTYPFATTVVVPDCYRGWTPKKRTIRYAGYHELSYMHPNYFTPNRQLAIGAGLVPQQTNLFIRLVSWQASHDKGHHGLDLQSLEKIILANEDANIMISSESALPTAFKPYAYQGPVDAVHHVLAFCDGFIGESPTMAIEAALWAVPGLFVSTIQCGNVYEIEQKYDLIRQIDLSQNANLQAGLDWLKNTPKTKHQDALHTLLENTEDVTHIVVKIITQHLQQVKAV